MWQEKDIAVEVHGYENMPSPGIEEDMYKVIANQPLACCMEWNENVSAYKEVTKNSNSLTHSQYYFVLISKTKSSINDTT